MTWADLSPLANHLWQSTIFAAAVWALTMTHRRNRAAVRYWLWLAASAKFLIPFSLLVSTGSQLGWRAAPAIEPAQWTLAAWQISHPFTTAVSAPQVAVPSASNPLPTLLVFIWLCGIAVSIVFWLRCWRTMRAVRCASSPLLTNLPIPVMSSPTRLEPGVCGIRNPILLVPESITERLTPAQLDAVLTHELCHVKRRDNLTGAVHMAVETIFWFHPLLWWIRSRLLEERERACDEQVLFLGTEPQVYAEGILNICKLYRESLAVCVSGLTGSNLGKRIETIMDHCVAVRLSFARKAVLAFAGTAAIAAPIVIGIIKAPAVQAQPAAATKLRFDAASIRPASYEGPDVKRPGLDVRLLPGGRLSAKGVLLRYFIQNAYGVEPFQISGGPDWINSAHYDIEAKAEGNPTNSQMRLMMQALLAERFKLRLHHETKELPVYELTEAKSGMKLKEPKQGSCIAPDPGGPPLQPIPGQPIPCGRVLMMMSSSRVRMQGDKVSMAELVRVLSNVLGRTVVDKTGFTAMFDVHLEFAPDESLGAAASAPGPAAANDSTRPVPSSDPNGTIFTALHEQLGLTLKSARGPVDVLIIDSLEKPSSN